MPNMSVCRLPNAPCSKSDRGSAEGAGARSPLRRQIGHGRPTGEWLLLMQPLLIGMREAGGDIEITMLLFVRDPAAEPR